MQYNATNTLFDGQILLKNIDSFKDLIGMS